MTARIFAVVLAVALVGCQTTATNHIALDARPLTGPITIGNSPVSNAVYKSESRIVLRQGVNSGYMEMTLEGLFSVVSLKDETEIELEYTKADVITRDLTTAMSKSDIEKLKGFKFKARFNASSNKLDISGNIPIKPAEEKQAQRMFAMFSKAFLFGRTVTQGQEVFNLDARELIGSVGGNISGRVVGQSIHDGRPVIALKGAGRITHQKISVDIDSTYYVDVFTGISVLSHTSMNATLENGTQMEVIEKQSVKLSSTAVPASSSITSGASQSDFPWSKPTQAYNPPPATPPAPTTNKSWW